MQDPSCKDDGLFADGRDLLGDDSLRLIQGYGIVDDQLLVDVACRVDLSRCRLEREHGSRVGHGGQRATSQFPQGLLGVGDEPVEFTYTRDPHLPVGCRDRDRSVVECGLRTRRDAQLRRERHPRWVNDRDLGRFE